MNQFKFEQLKTTLVAESILTHEVETIGSCLVDMRTQARRLRHITYQESRYLLSVISKAQEINNELMDICKIINEINQT